MTFLPLLLGREGTLSLGAALATYPASFIGHVAYGVITAMYFYFLERRQRLRQLSSTTIQPPPILPTSSAQSPLWVLMILFVVIVPIVLHT